MGAAYAVPNGPLGIHLVLRLGGSDGSVRGRKIMRTTPEARTGTSSYGARLCRCPTGGRVGTVTELQLFRMKTTHPGAQAPHQRVRRCLRDR